VKDKGPILLIAVLAILIVGMAGAALLMVRPAAGSSGSAAARPGVDFTVTLARASTGIMATVVVTNAGSEDLSELRVTRAAIASLTGTATLPLDLGKLARNGTTRLVLPYTGPAPAANAPVKLELQYDFNYGTFSNGSGSRDVTTIIP
jgi:hypothetical protein